MHRLAVLVVLAASDLVPPPAAAPVDAAIHAAPEAIAADASPLDAPPAPVVSAPTAPVVAARSLATATYPATAGTIVAVVVRSGGRLMLWRANPGNNSMTDVADQRRADQRRAPALAVGRDRAILCTATSLTIVDRNATQRYLGFRVPAVTIPPPTSRICRSTS